MTTIRSIQEGHTPRGARVRLVRDAGRWSVVLETGTAFDNVTECADREAAEKCAAELMMPQSAFQF